MVQADVIQGNCLAAMRRLPDASVDACITDPPYGTTACSWDSPIPFAPMWAELKRIVKRNGAIVLFGSQPFTSALVMSNPQMFKYEWIWKKNKGSNFQTVAYQPFKEHESICIFYREFGTYNPQTEARTASGLSRIGYAMKTERGINPITGLVTHTRPQQEDRSPSSVQSFNCEMGLHETQKPVELMRYLVRTYTNADETVLDFTCGSGSTGVAAVIEGRNFIGIEQDADYCAIAAARIKRAQGIAVDIPRRIRTDKVLPLFAELVA